MALCFRNNIRFSGRRVWRESERVKEREGCKTCIQLEKLNFYAYFPFLLLAYCSFYREYARQWPNQPLNYDNAFGSIGRPLFCLEFHDAELTKLLRNINELSDERRCLSLPLPPLKKAH